MWRDDRYCRFGIALFVALVLAPLATADENVEESNQASELISAPAVRLIDSGEDPRETLRLDPAVGQTERVRLKVDMETTMTLGGEPFPVDPEYPYLIEITVFVEEVDPNTKESIVVSSVTDASVLDVDEKADDRVEALKQGYSKIVGTIVRSRLNSRGIAIESSIEPPKGASPELLQSLAATQQSLNQMFTPLPEEPVGIGAQWEISQGPIGQTGIMQRSVFELVNRQGDRVDINLKLNQTAEPKQLSRSRLIELRTTGDGRMELDLNRITAVNASIEAVSESAFEIGDDSSPSILSQSVRFVTQIESTQVPTQHKSP